MRLFEVTYGDNMVVLVLAKDIAEALAMFNLWEGNAGHKAMKIEERDFLIESEITKSIGMALPSVQLTINR